MEMLVDVVGPLSLSNTLGGATTWSTGMGGTLFVDVIPVSKHRNTVIIKC